jgi:hypothetical protein
MSEKHGNESKKGAGRFWSPLLPSCRADRGATCHGVEGGGGGGGGEGLGQQRRASRATEHPASSLTSNFGHFADCILRR